MSDEDDLGWLFEGVSNEVPEVEFAFEVQGDMTIAEVLALTTEEEASERIRVVDDQGAEVKMVPLGKTSRVMMSGLFTVIPRGKSGYSSRQMPFPLEDEELPPHVVVEVFARMLQRWVRERPEWVACKEEEFRKIAFYRFYFSGEEGVWTVTFESDDVGLLV
jgi:hypothetical protein